MREERAERREGEKWGGKERGERREMRGKGLSPER